MTAALTDAQLDEAEALARQIRRGEVYVANLDALGQRILPGLVDEARRLRGERQLLARAAADQADERDAAEAERARLATELGALDALRAADQVAMEDLKAAYDRLGDQAQRIVEAASQFRAERDRLHDVLGDVLIGTWESNGAGDVRSPWIPAAEAEGWRRLLAGTPRSERDGETTPTDALDPADAQPDARRA